MLLDLIYPRKCAFCHQRMHSEPSMLCSECRETLPYAAEVRSKIPFIDECRFVLYYEGSVRDSLHRYKFGGLSLYAPVYGDLMLERLPDYLNGCDLIAYVPLSRCRLRARGYDQAKLIAEYLSKKTGIPCVAALKKKRNTAPQSQTGNAEKRKENISGAYRAMNIDLFTGKTVLLIDDIVTTGSTISECGSVLKAEGVKKIKALTVAGRRS